MRRLPIRPSVQPLIRASREAENFRLGNLFGDIYLAPRPCADAVAVITFFRAGEPRYLHSNCSRENHARMRQLTRCVAARRVVARTRVDRDGIIGRLFCSGDAKAAVGV